MGTASDTSPQRTERAAVEAGGRTVVVNELGDGRAALVVGRTGYDAVVAVLQPRDRIKLAAALDYSGRGELERLRDGLRERGIMVGRNPDGMEQTVDTALRILDEALHDGRA